MDNSRRLKVLLCGYGHLALALLQALLAQAEHCEVVGVYRWVSRPGGKAFWEPVEELLLNLVHQAGLYDVQCSGMNQYEFVNVLQALKPDVVLVASWGEILKPHILSYPGVLMVNCHPSKLPAHRGANPYASVLLQEEIETGVTFHKMVPQIDAGNILAQATVPLFPDDHGDSVRARCVEAASALLPSLIIQLKRSLLEGEPLPEQVQDSSKKSYYGQLKPEQALINWAGPPDTIYRQMRALYPWMVCHSYLYGWLHTLFLQSQFMEVSSLLPALQNRFRYAAPGTVLGWQSGCVIIRLASDTMVLSLHLYTFCLSSRLLCPLWLGSMVGRLLLRPGARFQNARVFVQTENSIA